MFTYKKEKKYKEFFKNCIQFYYLNFFHFDKSSIIEDTKTNILQIFKQLQRKKKKLYSFHVFNPNKDYAMDGQCNNKLLA